MRLPVSIGLCLFVAAAACTKWQDEPGTIPDLGNRYYCNNPDAINFNHGFPGIEDSTVCVFPSAPFTGAYSYRDSLYIADGPAIAGDTLDFSIAAIDRKKISVNGFCGSAAFLFTPNRYYKATADTVITGYGQLLCRSLDTMSGTLLYRPEDSSLLIDWTVISDTGTVTHRGRAYKK